MTRATTTPPRRLTRFDLAAFQLAPGDYSLVWAQALELAAIIREMGKVLILNGDPMAKEYLGLAIRIDRIGLVYGRTAGGSYEEPSVWLEDPRAFDGRAPLAMRIEGFLLGVASERGEQPARLRRPRRIHGAAGFAEDEIMGAVTEVWYIQYVPANGNAYRDASLLT